MANLTYVPRKVLLCSCYDLARFGPWRQWLACLPSSPEALQQGYGKLMDDFGELMSRSEILRSIEVELGTVRDMAARAKESILVYLLDMAILEVQSKIPTNTGKKDGSNAAIQFSKRYGSG